MCILQLYRVESQEDPTCIRCYTDAIRKDSTSIRIFFIREVSGGGQAVATGMLVAALFAVPLGVAQSGAQLLTPYALAIGLVVAVLSSMLPFLLDMYAMRWLPARVFGVLLSASPAMSALAGWWVLGETLGPLQILGVSAIMLACAGSALFARPANTGDQS